MKDLKLEKEMRKAIEAAENKFSHLTVRRDHREVQKFVDYCSDNQLCTIYYCKDFKIDYIGCCFEKINLINGDIEIIEVHQISSMIFNILDQNYNDVFDEY